MSRKQRVLLIRASHLESHLGLMITPPAGVLTLAAMLRRERPEKVEFRLLDTGIERMNAIDVGGIICEYEPDVVALSALSVESVHMHAIASQAKKINPNIKVIVGGPHATIFYDQVLEDPDVDYAVVGEGDFTFIELLDAVRDGSLPENMPGVAFRKDEEIKYGGPREGVEDLDSLPVPAWDLVDLKKYSKKITMNGIMARTPFASLFTTRACPYRCVYCHHIFGKKFRAQSAERVLEEIELLSSKFGVRELHIYDDIFNLDANRVIEIMEGLQKRGIDMRFAFPNGIRADIMTRDVTRAMAKGGVYSVTFAIETASPRLQKLIRKNLNLDKAHQAIEWAFDEGMIPCGFYMFGFPTETVEEIEQTIRFAVNSKMLSAVFFTAVPFPRSELYEMVRKYYPDFELPYDFSPNMYYWSQEPYYTKVTGIDLLKFRFKALRKFYSRPWRIYHMIERFPKNLSYLRLILFSLLYWTVGYGRNVEINQSSEV